MTLWKQKNVIWVTCPKGSVEYLKTEIVKLGFPILNELDTGVQTEGTLEDTMIFNLHLRTAQRVLYRIEQFKAISPGALYERVQNIPWENLLHAKGPYAYLCVTSVTDHPLITDSRFANLKVKDAIVDRIREKRGARPDSGPDRHKAVVHLYWKNDQATVFIDTSGERLSMRGYRKIPLTAPLSEGLAATLIAASGWQGRAHFINPMCGSGTLAIEAALIAQNRAPGMFSRSFGLMYIQGFPTGLWQDLRQKARRAADSRRRHAIIATDIDEQAISAARQNAQTAGVEHLIDFRVCPFEQTPVPEGGGVIMMNPPYGERLEAVHPPVAVSDRKRMDRQGNPMIVRKLEDHPVRGSGLSAKQKLEALYAATGDFFKQAPDGYRGYLFTGNLDMAKQVGLKTRRRLLFYNGDLECRLLEYELYAGSRKHKPRETDAVPGGDASA